MAPPDQVSCSASGCDNKTSEEAPDFQTLTEHLNLHARLAHPAGAPAGGGHGQSANLDKKIRPFTTMGMTEIQWRFYLSECKRYKRQTGISEQTLRDELWNTMDAELRQLAFSEGTEDSLVPEDLTLARIKSLVVTILHPSLHIVALHKLKQLPSETSESFSVRCRGILANCNLTKKCPNAACARDVSYLEETCYHVVMSGLHDVDMKDHAWQRGRQLESAESKVAIREENRHHHPLGVASAGRSSTAQAGGLTGRRPVRRGGSSGPSASASGPTT